MKAGKSNTIRNGAIAIVVLVVLAVGVRAAIQQFRPAQRQLPTARAKRGTLQIKVFATGDLRATNAVSLMAPPLAGGGALQIISLVKTSTRVQAGDVVIEFDPSEQQYKLAQARSQVAEAEQQITKSKDDAAVSVAQDKVSLLTARFDVRRAELDVSRNELLSAIDAQKNVLALDEARRRLAQLEQDVKSRVASNQASLAVLEEKRNKALLDMRQAQQAIESLKVKARIAGVVSIKENVDAGGLGWAPPGIVMPDYREGDVVRPGRVVAEVLETNDMEIRGKIGEADRSNVAAGQRVEVRVDAYPGLVLPGHVKSVAAMTTTSGWGSDNTRTFDASFQIDKPDPRLRSGQTSHIVIDGPQIRDALFLPAQAVFDKDGKPVLYVREGDKFQERAAKITHRTETQVTVQGLKEGDEVALINPEKQPSPAQQGLSQGGSR